MRYQVSDAWRTRPHDLPLVGMLPPPVLPLLRDISTHRKLPSDHSILYRSHCLLNKPSPGPAGSTTRAATFQLSPAAATPSMRGGCIGSAHRLCGWSGRAGRHVPPCATACSRLAVRPFYPAPCLLCYSVFSPHPFHHCILSILSAAGGLPGLPVGQAGPVVRTGGAG
jgi:hypothetical protein